MGILKTRYRYTNVHEWSTPVELFVPDEGELDFCHVGGETYILTICLNKMNFSCLFR